MLVEAPVKSELRGELRGDSLAAENDPCGLPYARGIKQITNRPSSSAIP